VARGRLERAQGIQRKIGTDQARLLVLTPPF
jgi:hypothetical protein